MDLSGLPGYSSARISADYSKEARDLQRDQQKRADSIGIGKMIGQGIGLFAGGPLWAALGALGGSAIGRSLGPDIKGGQFLQGSREDILGTESTKMFTDALTAYATGVMMPGAGGKGVAGLGENVKSSFSDKFYLPWNRLLKDEAGMNYYDLLKAQK